MENQECIKGLKHEWNFVESKDGYNILFCKHCGKSMKSKIEENKKKQPEEKQMKELIGDID